MAKKQNNQTWENMIKPVVVLFTICLVVSGLLAVTNNITAPIIAENALKAEQAALIELLPEAEAGGFTEIEGVEMDNVNKVYKSNDGVGYVITAAAKGYGGDVEWMVAFDDDGVIQGAKVLSQSETAGLGAKCEEPWFREQFIGKSEDVSKDTIDMIGGATITSNATITAINAARRAFNQYGKGIFVTEKTLEEKLGELFGEGQPAAVEGEDGIYTTPNGVIVTGSAKGFSDDIKAYVAINEDGTIAGVLFEVPEGDNLGGPVNESPFIDQFKGVTTVDGIDTIAGATYSSTGAIDAVKAALASYMGEDAVVTDTPAEDEKEDTSSDTTAEEPAADDGSVTGTAKGFQGDIVAHVVFNEDGTIASVEFDVPASDNLGGPVNESPFKDQFIGKSSVEDIDTISGATYSSQGAIDAVKAAIEANAK